MTRPALGVLIMASLLAASSVTAEEGGATTLFDGKTLTGWSPVGGQPGNWVVHDGLLVTKGQGGGWLSTDKTYANFTLQLEYKVGPGGNSGVFIRSPRSGDPAYVGMEIQILDDDDKQYKNLRPFQYTGSVYGVVAAKRGHAKPPGEWNRMEITADGPKIVVKLNGDVIVDANLDEHSDAAKAHPGILRKDGYVGLQSHSDEVVFRNVTIRERK